MNVYITGISFPTETIHVCKNPPIQFVVSVGCGLGGVGVITSLMNYNTHVHHNITVNMNGYTYIPIQLLAIIVHFQEI